MVGRGRKAEAKGAARNGEGVVDVEVGKGGGRGFANKDGNTCFSGVVSEG